MRPGSELLKSGFIGFPDGRLRFRSPLQLAPCRSTCAPERPLSLLLAPKQPFRFRPIAVVRIVSPGVG